MRTVVLLLLALLAPAAARAATTAAGANEEGAALFAAGRVEEATARFREALALDPSLATVRCNLAAALATLGQRAMQAGNLDDARPLLEEAADRCPGDARFPFLAGMLHFSRGDLYEARRRADQAIAGDPGFSPARELSGDVSYREGNLGAARAAWEAGLPGAAGTPREQALRAKIGRAAREEEAGAGFGREVSRHFTIEYDGPVPPAVAREALRLLEEAYDRLWRALDRAPQHDVPVILYAAAAFRDLNPHAPAWASGTYDGKIRLPIGGLATGEDARCLAPILAHELAHAFLRANVPAALPLWFEEGVAQHFAGVPEEADRQVLAREGLAFARLDDVSRALRGGSHVAAAYAAAHLAVEELIRRDGDWLLRRILEVMGRGQPFAEAFRGAAGASQAEFEERRAAGR